MNFQYLMYMADESQLPIEAITIFAWSSKTHTHTHTHTHRHTHTNKKTNAVLCYPDGRLCIFYWLILDAFDQVLLSVGLTESSTSWNESFGFQRKLIIDHSFPISPYTHHLFWMKTGHWCGWWWFISLSPWSLLFHVIIQYSLFITYHNLF